MRIQVSGSPIAGEDVRESDWVARIADACSVGSDNCAGGRAEFDSRELMLQFTLMTGRNLDLDNLIRPAIRGLVKGNLLQKGGKGVDCVTASKSFGEREGLLIETRRDSPPSKVILEVCFDRLPKGDNTSDWKLDWTERVRERWIELPVQDEVWVALEVLTRRSLTEVMKPILDGLEPFLGRDTCGRLTFCPNDHRITWFQIQRVSSGLPLRLTAGLPSAGH